MYTAVSHDDPKRLPEGAEVPAGRKSSLPPGPLAENRLEGKFRGLIFGQPERLPLGPAGTDEVRASNGGPPNQPKKTSDARNGAKTKIGICSRKGAKAAKRTKACEDIDHMIFLGVLCELCARLFFRV